MSAEQFITKPDMKISVKQTFGFDSEMQIDAFSKKNEYVPKIDADYKFDKDTRLRLLQVLLITKEFLFKVTMELVNQLTLSMWRQD